MSLDGVRNIILILSGKGGVGKSSTTLQLALTLTLRNYTVAILDVDLTGPSIPHLLSSSSSSSQTRRTITQSPQGWIPAQAYPAKPGSDSSGGGGHGALYALSLGHLAAANQAVIWRGPKKTAMIRQFLTSVAWEGIDFLLVDTPPGTGDEHIALVETLGDVLLQQKQRHQQEQQQSPLPKENGIRGAGHTEKDAAGGTTTSSTITTTTNFRGAVVVTTPQAVSTADVRKELGFCAKVGVPVLGVVENMAGYTCPCCGEVTRVFGEGGGEVMARERDVRFLGRVPVDAEWGLLVEEGKTPRRLGVRVGEQAREGDGSDGTTVEKGEETARQQEGKTQEQPRLIEDTLVAKYQLCRLCPIYQDIVTEMLKGFSDAVDPP